MFNKLRGNVTKVVMDNVTFEGIKNMTYKAGYTKGWWSGALITGIGALVLAAKCQADKEKEEEHKDEEVVYTQDSDD